VIFSGLIISTTWLGKPDWNELFLIFRLLLGTLLVLHWVATVSKSSLYKSVGQLVLTDESISIATTKVPLVAIKQINLRYTSFRGEIRPLGRGLGDGVGNVLRYALKADGKELEYVFMAESRTQRDHLVSLLKIWRASGVKVLVDGIDLV
jgi:hypothetical protein